MAQTLDEIARFLIEDWKALVRTKLMTNPADIARRDMTALARRPQLDYSKLKTELIYGRSGSGKTSWLLKLARYIFLKTGKRTAWLLGDGGGETVTITGWADEGGFIDLYPYIIRDNPIETSQRICEGYRVDGDMLDPKVRLVPRTPEELDAYGLWVFEGLNTMSDYMMGEKEGGMANRMARGEMLNKDDSFRFKDGDIQFGGNARTHYGYVQRKMLDLIGRSTRLPGVKYWTAHELKVDDTENRESIFGPDIVGQKLTTRIGGSFGNTIHMHVAHVERTGPVDPLTKKAPKIIEAQYRAYTQTHYDPDAQTQAKYFANTRMDARVREAYPTLMPEYIFPADPLRFYGLLDEARRKEAELDEQMLQAAPDIELVKGRPEAPVLNRSIDLG